MSTPRQGVTTTWATLPRPFEQRLNQFRSQHAVGARHMDATGHRAVRQRWRRSGDARIGGGRRWQWLGQLADMPWRIGARSARIEELRRQIGQTIGDVARRCDISPMIADAQLNHAVAERHTTQVGAMLSDPGEAVEHVAAAVVEREQETPRQQAEFGVCTEQFVEPRCHATKISAPTGQSVCGETSTFRTSSCVREGIRPVDSIAVTAAAINWRPSPAHSAQLQIRASGQVDMPVGMILADLGQSSQCLGG